MKKLQRWLDIASDPTAVRAQLVRDGVLRRRPGRGDTYEHLEPTLRLLGTEDWQAVGWMCDESGPVEWVPPRPERDGRGVEWR
jgi:hypothetical protein